MLNLLSKNISLKNVKCLFINLNKYYAQEIQKIQNRLLNLLIINEKNLSLRIEIL